MRPAGAIRAGLSFARAPPRASSFQNPQHLPTARADNAETLSRTYILDLASRHMPSLKTRDRPALAKQEEIQITPEMIAAGVDALVSSGRLAEGPMSGDDLLAQQVFRAMYQCRCAVLRQANA